MHFDFRFFNDASVVTIGKTKKFNTFSYEINDNLDNFRYNPRNVKLIIIKKKRKEMKNPILR